jgi:hypothetical protein
MCSTSGYMSMHTMRMPTFLQQQQQEQTWRKQVLASSDCLQRLICHSSAAIAHDLSLADVHHLLQPCINPGAERFVIWCPVNGLYRWIDRPHPRPRGNWYSCILVSLLPLSLSFIPIVIIGIYVAIVRRSRGRSCSWTGTRLQIPMIHLQRGSPAQC